ncbi:MAG: hypothetical protein COB66_06660, partial [Coxiella sp. (in: Bacteria)]
SGKIGDAPVPLENQLVRGLAEGIGALHRARIIHGDMSDQNVLVMLEGGRYIAKYSDMGNSHLCEDPKQRMKIKRGHIDFEDKAMCALSLKTGSQFVTLTGCEAFAKDMYGVGRLILQVMTRKSLFSSMPYSCETPSIGAQIVECAQYISSGKATVDLRACGIFGGVVDALLKDKPSERLTAGGLSETVTKINNHLANMTHR